MKKLLLFLIPAVIMGMLASCDEAQEGGAENGTDVTLGVGANQIKIGSNITSFTFQDSLVFRHEMFNLYPESAYDEQGRELPVKGTVLRLYLSASEDLLNQEIDLSPNGVKGGAFEQMSFEMDLLSSNEQVMAFSIGSSVIQNGDSYDNCIAGVVGQDSITNVFKSGKLVMNIDWSKKIFTLKISATLWDGRDFQLYVSAPLAAITYPFNMVPHTSTYTRYEWNSDKERYDTITTDLSAADAAAEKYNFGLMFQVEAADLSDEARFAAYKKAVSMFQDAVNMIDGAKIQAGCVATRPGYEEGFALKLETWGTFGQLFLGYHKWKNADTAFIDEGFIMTDDEIREAISKDYIEYVELEY